VGFLDPAVLTGQGDVVFVLLSGRSWIVREVDWKRRLAWLEPAKEGGKARWMGGGRGMSAELAESIRTVIRSGAISHGTLSRRAAAALEQICDETPTGAAYAPVQMIGTGRYRLWTFAGSTVNRTLMLACRASGAYLSDGLSVDFRIDPRLMGETVAMQPLPKSELEVLVKATKFSDLLPDAFSSRLATARLLADDEAVLNILRRVVAG
jgi:ATP-dependent Lhr-like helicase